MSDQDFKSEFEKALDDPKAKWGQSGRKRMSDALAVLDDRASMILALHAALERELDSSFEDRFPRPAALRGHGFKHKVSIWHASVLIRSQIADKMAKALYQFNELRNSVAHGDGLSVVNGHIAALQKILDDETYDGHDADTLTETFSYMFGIFNGANAMDMFVRSRRRQAERAQRKPDQP